MALDDPRDGARRSASAADHSGVRRYYATIRNYLWLVALCTAITVAAAAAYVALAPRTYTAEAQLLVNPAASTNTIAFDLPVLHTSGDPTRDVLTASSFVMTPQVAGSVARQLHLDASPSDLLSKIQATPVGQSSIVAIQAKASSPSQAQALANAFANQTIVVRTQALHAAVARQIPPLQAEVNALPSTERGGSGSLGEQLTQLQQLQRSNDPTLAIAAAAQLPTGPSSPKTKLSLAAGLFGGLLLGIGGAFGFTALDPRLRREEQLRELFGGIPVLARIPLVGPRSGKTWPLVPDDLSPPALEGYRTLRTTLSARSGREPRSCLVTGAGASEGKTTTAVCLAVAMARAGSRVILLEADLRRPRIASALGLDVKYGTEQVLIGEADLADALVPVLFDNTMVQVLAAQTAGVELADRLSYPVAVHLLDSAKARADYVVIDSPPLTAVKDALPLAQLSDETLIVTRLGETRLNKLAELEDLLRTEGAYPSGIVLIGAADTADGYSYAPAHGITLRAPGPEVGNIPAERVRTPVRRTT
jgi:polysaccharide biosynthesis transport protein